MEAARQHQDGQASRQNVKESRVVPTHSSSSAGSLGQLPEPAPGSRNEYGLGFAIGVMGCAFAAASRL